MFHNQHHIHINRMESISVSLKASKDIENGKKVVVAKDNRSITDVIIDKQNDAKSISKMVLTTDEIFMLR